MHHALPAPNPADLLAAAVAEAVRLASLTTLPADEALHLVGSMSHQLMRALAECERSGWSRERILEAVSPARAAHAGSPFCRRLQQWPRGYAGDFETVEYIVQQRNDAPDGSFAYWVEQFGLDSPIAQQHRNKVRLQARAILDVALALRDTPDGARVLVIASGGAADIALVQQELAMLNVRLVLVDQDPDALTFARARLPLLESKITTVCRNVVRGLGAVRAHGPFDLVLAGGLFDYLPDDVASAVLRQARERLLAPECRFLFTNIADGNPYRRWIEYLGDWQLIHRSPADVMRLCEAAGFEGEGVTVTREQTGLALVVTAAAADCRDESASLLDTIGVGQPAAPA